MAFLLVGVMVLLSSSPAPGQSASYSAVVMDLSGKATATRQGEVRVLELGWVLYPGDMVETAPGASLTLYYPESGEEEQWPGDLKFMVGTHKSEPRHPGVTSRNRKITLPSLESPPGGLKVRAPPKAPEPAEPGR